MKCLYHSKDLDGIMSGFIVKKNFPDCQMYPFDYEDNIPNDFLIQGKIKNEKVIIIDLSPTKNQMESILENKKVIWIDHHLTTKKTFDEIGYDTKSTLKKRIIEFIFDSKVSACYLAYQYFNSNKKIPVGINLLSLYDTGKLKEDKRALQFNYGVKGSDLSNNPNIFNEIYQGTADIKEILKAGKAIESYLDFFIEINYKKIAKEVTFDGKSGIALNIIGLSSFCFNDYWSDEYDLLILYYRNNQNMWKVSVYTRSSDINVGEICAKYGGGGHVKAAGFMTSTLPFAV